MSLALKQMEEILSWLEQASVTKISLIQYKTHLKTLNQQAVVQTETVSLYLIQLDYRLLEWGYKVVWSPEHHPSNF